MSKLGFTFYPKDWWTSETFYALSPIERYVYLECIFLMYVNDGFIADSKANVERRLCTTISDSVWLKVVALMDKTEDGRLTHKSVNSRIRKAISNRENGKKGGRPPKQDEENPNNPTCKPKQTQINPNNPTLKPNENPPLEREREREREREELGTSHKMDLSNSNLYRKPVIPTIGQVTEQFILKGGTKEMAEKFFTKHDSVGWYLNNSPIKNFTSLIPGYIQSWRDNEEQPKSASIGLKFNFI